MQINKKFNYFILANLVMQISLFLSSCSTEEDYFELKEEDQMPIRLLSAFKISKPSKTNIRNLINSIGLGFPVSQMKYNFQIWNITYATIYKGSNIIAPGRAFVPLGYGEELNYLTFAHGTITANRDAPSELSTEDIKTFVYAAMASTGFISVVPDFICFGSSEKIMYSYYVEETSTLVVVDGLRAVRELMSQEEISPDAELYLIGYLEGGYLAMATHKYIEENGLKYFNLRASFPACGGYYMKGVRDFFFDQDIYKPPYYMAYIAEFCRTYYDIDTSRASQIFNKPYAQRIINIFDGISDGSQINSQLNDTVAVLISVNFLSNPDDQKFSEISDLFEQNSMMDWKLKIPTYLYYGDADIIIPYQNSVDTYTSFLALGGSPEIVTLTSFEM